MNNYQFWMILGYHHLKSSWGSASQIGNVERKSTSPINHFKGWVQTLEPPNPFFFFPKFQWFPEYRWEIFLRENPHYIPMRVDVYAVLHLFIVCYDYRGYIPTVFNSLGFWGFKVCYTREGWSIINYPHCDCLSILIVMISEYSYHFVYTCIYILQSNSYRMR
jgi:hypothetical protein